MSFRVFSSDINKYEAIKSLLQSTNKGHYKKMKNSFNHNHNDSNRSREKKHVFSFYLLSTNEPLM